MRRRIARYERDTAGEWDETRLSFERRLGNATLADLEEGDERAARITARSLRKEAMKLMTADAERRERAECPRQERTTE